MTEPLAPSSDAEAPGPLNSVSRHDRLPSQLLSAYLEQLSAQGRSAHTLSSTRLDLLQLLRFLGRQAPESVSVQDLRTFVEWLRRQHRNRPSSLRRKTSTIKGFFRFLHSRGLIAEDPATLVPYPPRAPNLAKPLSSDEGDAIVGGAHTPSWTGLVSALLDCGLKRDEVAALRWEDVDFDVPPHGVLRVRHRLMSQRTRRRTLALSARLAAALREHRSESGATGTVFSISPRGVDFIVETCARRAGVRPDQKVTPQMLRDAFACARVVSNRQQERIVARDPAALRALQQQHDATLLRELGLAKDSSAAVRYRRLVDSAQGDRAEQRVLVDA